ncbi:SDR family NAD(P)-dependent oxidoreductase [Streptomyces sp. V4I2]|uniref:SDR family NAD(P)-dependent oxidoreductase n=1 Tax=Streptomyces sp. V4I2 TaxID=3042280 RepID=UPI002786EA51|nr:SDR family NAD(P)-dependent oxidoreductase [Streptomyces sp. V4I2]MDQ1050828.1 NAD(P)-dependent dehydrogenase (short-subunit alcohol dehydrogenase family) [Streptomyces sp. V4I2]
MNDTMITLVTGANKGIGREIAAQLAALGHIVVIGARSAELGEKAAAELRATGADATSVVLDVTDPASAAAAADAVEARHGRLDALVNNAGVARPPGSDLAAQRPRSADLDVIRRIFDTNFFGVITVTNALLPLLRRSSAPRVVNVSSSAGSLAAGTDPEIAAVVYAGLSAADLPLAVGYVPSKTALNALTVQYARDLHPDGILVNAVCPGYCATDLNNHSGHRTAAQGAVAAVRMATVPADGPTGTFTDDQGSVPW